MDLLLGFVLGVASSIVATAVIASWARWPPPRRRRAIVASTAVLALGGTLYGAIAVVHAFRDPDPLWVRVSAHASGQGTWSGTIIAQRGDVVSYRLWIKNPGPGNSENVNARVNPPAHHQFVCGSIERVTGTGLSGEFVTGEPRSCPGITLMGDDGIKLGDIAEGGAVTLQWEARLAQDASRARPLITVGVGQAEGRNEVYNTARVQILPGS